MKFFKGGLLILLLLPVSTLASGFSLTPGKIELELAPGASLTKTVTVTNDSDQSSDYKVLVTDLPEAKNNLASLKPFIKVSEDSFRLTPKAQKTLAITVAVPKNISPQSYHGAVFIETVGQAGATSGLVRLGTLIFVRIAGDRLEVGQAVGFKLLNGFLAKAGAIIPTAVVFKNTGNTYLNPYGLITINTIWGHRLGYAKINPWYVLPGEIKAHDLGLKNPGVGVYQLKLQLNRGYNNIIDQQNRYVVIWSWPIVGLVVLLILVVGYLLARFWFKWRLRQTI